MYNYKLLSLPLDFVVALLETNYICVAINCPLVFFSVLYYNKKEITIRSNHYLMLSRPQSQKSKIVIWVYLLEHCLETSKVKQDSKLIIF